MDVEQRKAARAVAGRRGLKVASLAGTEIRLDVSLVFVFVLVVGSLATGLLQHWHPEWATGARWLFAVVVAVLFFGSILAHELAHAVVARLFGIPVPRITLFLFGGVSEMESEPLSPGHELAIAVAGPLASLAIGLACTLAGVAVAGPDVVRALEVDPRSAYRALDPLATMLLWLGPVNVVLAVFNLIPGFPLDGGRVLRAGLWKATGDRVAATRWASFGGQLVAWTLIGIGVVQALTGLLGGLWLVLIGWFLDQAARTSRADVLVRQALEGVRVADLMRTRFEDIRADFPLVAFVDERVLRGAQSAWPVVRDDRVVGIVSVEDVARVPERAREGLEVGDVMRPVEHALAPGLPGRDAVQAVARADEDALPVLDHGRLVGILHRGDIVRWLALHEGTA